MNKPLLRRLYAFVLAVVVMAALGSVASTQFVLAGLSSVGAEISIRDRLWMTGFDLLSFAPPYAAVIAAGFLIAFTAAGLIANRLPIPRGAVFALAGAVCIAAMLVLIKQVFFGMSLIAGTRGTDGITVQVLSGAVAGWLFARISETALR